ncbi:protein tyrosine phosphatase domain-containing protein 1-like [Bombina bombina]|uniref:protein tyrosine phosphatase domain-containing protein 1-like n=1 Tax=Bombina bombina TaxID=8345 RepID=UPI00235ADC6F|nr:protein tyrosine phosphatase domain-containing protein 1-like [Bombina bombina]
MRKVTNIKHSVTDEVMSSPDEVPLPSYSHTRERLVRAVHPHIICSLTCGGRECRYEGPEGWSAEQQAIKGLYSSWITDEIIAMSRPSTRLVQKYNITEQFSRFGIRSLVSAQIPWEHPYCGDPLDSQSGFSYNPQDFMDSGVSFYNFGLPDFGVVPVPRILDAVKVITFALREGKVAVHCHAGLGRTGVLIACYLIFSCRVHAADAVRFVRLRRPGSIQTGAQVSLICDFAMFLTSQWPVFPCSPADSLSFTLPQYLICQRHLLHGQEARSLRHLPKPVVMICQRLAQLASGRRGRGGSLADMEREASNRLLCQVIMRASSDRHQKPPLNICDSKDEEDSTRGKRRNRILQSHMSCDTGILQLLLTGDKTAEAASNVLCHLDPVHMTTPRVEGKLSEDIERRTDTSTTNNGDIERPTPPHVLNIAEALAELEVPDTETQQTVHSLKLLLNEEGAWSVVSTESNPRVLCSLLWDWLKQLKEPVLSLEDVNLLCDGNWRQNLTKLSRCQGETLCCLLQCVSKFTSLPPSLEDMVLLRVIRGLTQLPKDGPNMPSNVLQQLRSIEYEIRLHRMTARGLRKQQLPIVATQKMQQTK